MIVTIIIAIVITILIPTMITSMDYYNGLSGRNSRDKLPGVRCLGGKDDLKRNAQQTNWAPLALEELKRTL